MRSVACLTMRHFGSWDILFQEHCIFLADQGVQLSILPGAYFQDSLYVYCRSNVLITLQKRFLPTIPNSLFVIHILILALLPVVD